MKVEADKEVESRLAWLYPFFTLAPCGRGWRFAPGEGFVKVNKKGNA
jgi:hypothetical protein